MEFEENTMETNCLWLLWNLLAWATMSRGCHRSENKLPEGAGWETIDKNNLHNRSAAVTETYDKIFVVFLGVGESQN